MTNTPPQRDVLPQNQVEEIFERSIKPLMSGPAKEQPVAVFIGGQPGAGKSTLEAQLVESKGLRDAVRIDGDDLLLFHPRYAEHARANDRTAAAVCSDPRWWNMAVEHVREQRADVVISSPLAGPEWAQERFKDFRDAGYRVETVFVAVDDARSQLGIVDRYQAMRDDQGYGRWVGPEWHDTAYQRVLETADAIDRNQSTDAVHVGLRGGEIVHSNESTPDGGWRLAVPTREVIERERARPWTEQEQTRFNARVESLATRVPEDLKPLLARTVERAQTHLPAAQTQTATAQTAQTQTKTAQARTGDEHTQTAPPLAAASAASAAAATPGGLTAAAASRSGPRVSSQAGGGVRGTALPSSPTPPAPPRTPRPASSGGAASRSR
ncbi:zeta toxin family protein [Streptomyces sp. NPDC050564]|uniref:zeta toxin family protein n=1 Tax=Streptomyces sp. NPDC050564 TaxID=3365631 RepID=UPI0037A42AAB